MKQGDSQSGPDGGRSGLREVVLDAEAHDVALPALLPSQATPETQHQAESFFRSIADIFEAWVGRHASRHTQDAYRRDVMTFVKFQGIAWPAGGWELFRIAVPDVQRWRDEMASQGRSPNTIGRRLSSLSGFYNYLAGVAAEMRLPLTLPNPASAKFISRPARDPVSPTLDLSPSMARQLLALPAGETPVDYRDRAILAVYIYTGVRRSTACRLEVRDFLDDDRDRARLNIKEKGGKSRVIGLHHRAADAIRQYVARVGPIASDSPLFRVQRNPRSSELGDRALHPRTMHDVVTRYLRKLTDTPDGEPCRYSAHSLRATTATQLLTAGVDIAKVQNLLGHKHVTTTQIYDKRRYTTDESASHDVPI